jgi:hypothetical protein
MRSGTSCRCVFDLVLWRRSRAAGLI